MKALFDFDTEEELRAANGDIHAKLHYALFNVSFGLDGEVARRSTRLLKTIFGNSIYMSNALYIILKSMVWKFDVELDQGKKVFKDVEIQSFWAFNGMLSIKKYIINPLTFVNDGFFEIQFNEGP